MDTQVVSKVDRQTGHKRTHTFQKDNIIVITRDTCVQWWCCNKRKIVSGNPIYFSFDISKLKRTDARTHAETSRRTLGTNNVEMPKVQT